MKNQVLFLLAGILAFALGCQPSSSSSENRSPSDGAYEDSAALAKRGETKLDLASFTGIVVQLPAQVTISHGNAQEVTISAPRAILDDLDTEVHNGVWKITTRSRINNFRNYLQGEDDVKVSITLPSLDRIDLASSGSVRTTDPFNVDGTLDLELSGSGNIRFEGEAKKMDCVLTGSGNIQVDGQARTLEVDISGSGMVNTEHLETEEADIEISGSGDCLVNAREQLEVRITGSGEVRYKGDPKVRSKIWGSGDVIRLR